MLTNRQIASFLEKSMNKWDYNKAIRLSDNETKTRDYLIEPLFNMLGYNKMDHYSHEFSLKYSSGNVKKVDMVITLTGRAPIILVECKKANANLTKRNYNQLAEYFEKHKESKIGMLTNGVSYEFYSVKWNDKKALHDKPFLVFDLKNFTHADLEDLAQFHRHSFDIKKIMEMVEEKYFLEDFDGALFNTLYPPTDEFIKSIFDNMGGNRLTDTIRQRIFKLVNSISLQEALKKVRTKEGKHSKSGIVTTLDELKSLQIIKTILAMSSKINNNDLDRVGYKDYKGLFKIIIDDMPSKQICYLVLNSYKKSINIKGKEYILKSISPKEITKYRKHIVNEAVRLLN
ncbi:MAG: type I restriction enzyme HsdR N-terminal domain-containing protein [Candidatus Neomarinimicrobiota bacterium]